ncbi:hypothetical protein GCM10009655_11170 [Rhodoglobus aureus]|uniref:Uncharacterized protein n=1 Tax=Rhodoglobus aureus TaxID=191497 RepID=A0ABN1VJ48_9MICO
MARSARLRSNASRSAHSEYLTDRVLALRTARLRARQARAATSLDVDAVAVETLALNNEFLARGNLVAHEQFED